MSDTDISVLLWDKTLETGVAWIDDQHKQLLERVEKLVLAIKKQKGEDKVKELISFLGSYVQRHFSAEQNYMQRYNYPKSADHLDQHRQFIDKFKHLEQKYLRTGASRQLAGEIANGLWGWYKEHICKYDKKLGVFLKIRKAKEERAHKLPEKTENQTTREQF